MLGIVATLKVQAGKEKEFEDVFRNLAEQVRKNEQGCKLYELFRTQEDGQTYVVMEKYATQGDIDTHMKSPYFREAGGKFQSLLAAPPEVKMLNFVL